MQVSTDGVYKPAQNPHVRTQDAPGTCVGIKMTQTDAVPRLGEVYLEFAQRGQFFGFGFAEAITPTRNRDPNPRYLVHSDKTATLKA